MDITLSEGISARKKSIYILAELEIGRSLEGSLREVIYKLVQNLEIF